MPEPFKNDGESSIESSKTFAIDLSESVREYRVNPEFREYVESGSFVYVDGHFIIDDPTYVRQSAEGKLSLTDYAKAHLDECCIRFELRDRATSEIAKSIRIDQTHDTIGHGLVPLFELDKQSNTILERAEDIAKAYSNSVEHKEFEASITNLNFSEMVYAHIRRLGLNQVVFSQRTLLDARHYRKFKSGKPGRFSFDTVMAICIGLDLGILYGVPLLDKGGHSLNSEDRHPYKMLLEFFRGRTIPESNVFLECLGAQPIREAACRAQM